MRGLRTLGMTVTVLSVLAGVVTGAHRVEAETLTVGAAHSLKAAFEDLLPMFEQEYGATVNVVYGPSHTLRRQIEKGALIDVFLPEAAEELENLHRKGLTRNGGPRIYAQTSLVLVMSAASQAAAVSLGDELPDRPTRIAVADPRISALGKITARALARLAPGPRNRLQLVYADHSADILDQIRTGQAELGIVYRADAINGGQVYILDETPAGTHLPVQLGQAVVWTCREENLRVAEEFLDFIMSPRIQKLLVHYGFDSTPS